MNNFFFFLICNWIKFFIDSLIFPSFNFIFQLKLSSRLIQLKNKLCQKKNGKLKYQFKNISERRLRREESQRKILPSLCFLSVALIKLRLREKKKNKEKRRGGREEGKAAKSNPAMFFFWLIFCPIVFHY